jgi:hypothetical protein
MPQSQNGITYFVRNADGKTNRRETWRPGVNQTSEILQCNWSDYDAFTTDLLGYATWVGGVLQRKLPMFHPVWGWMICTEYELIEVIGTPAANGDVGQFDPASTPLAVIGATFQSVLYATLTDEQAASGGGGELSRYVQRQSRYGLELLELKGTQLQFADRNSTIGASPTRPYPNAPLIYSWYRVPALLNVPGGSRPDGFPLALWNNIVATIGKLNSDTFDGFYPPGTLLCGTPEIEQLVGPLGGVEFTVKYNFTYHSPQDNISPLGGPINTDSWNVKYSPFGPDEVTVKPGMYPVQIGNSGGDTPFRKAPFAKLFQNV